ncbi:MAG: MBL fold metallo-hydrolase [Candidatus Pacebacteria bacterium]|nr:MBL fold metallo-hydrolase [Candidatus Paceibacterota bacterium]
MSPHMRCSAFFFSHPFSLFLARSLCYNIPTMVITYQGLECFKLQFGDLTVVTNPPARDSVFKTSKFGADVVLQTVLDEDMAGGEDYSYGDKKPFIINGPGEYETRGVFIRGFPSVSKYHSANDKTDSDEGESINTIYTFQIDGINLCFLGALGSTDLKPETVEGIDTVDILFVPIGGEGVLTAAEAYKLGVKLEAKLIIPMHYEGTNGKIKEEALKTFLKEAGESAAPTDKLTIKKKDLEGKEGDVVVLSKV